VLITIIGLMGGVIYGYATLNSVVAETGRIVARIEARMESDSGKIDKIHDHGIEMDMRLRAIERKVGLADIPPSADRDSERK
jgi:hypothetical protein